jgi:hypothetical protein
MPTNITTDRASHSLSIEVTDSGSGVNTTTINGSAIRVTGPNSFSKLCTVVSKVPASGNASTIIAELAIAGPFSSSTNGVFEARSVAGAVADVAGNAVADNFLGQFQCLIGVPPADTTPPTFSSS